MEQEIPKPQSLDYQPSPDARMDDCYRCGYDLRGIAHEQPCPECGLLARRSRHQSDELYDTRPRWLRSISWGVNLILLAIVIAGAWCIAGPLLLDYMYSHTNLLQGRPWYELWPLFGFYLAELVLVCGVIFLTRLEGYTPADRADRRLRWTLRAAAFIPLIRLVLQSVQTVVQYNQNMRSIYIPESKLLDWTIFGFSTIGFVPLPLLLFFQLRGLAKRARSARLAEHCAIIGIGTSAAILYFVGVVLLNENADRLGLGLYWTGRSNVFFAMEAFLAAVAILFVLWSAQLLIRFAIAFRRAARQMRGKWQHDDRSIAANG